MASSTLSGVWRLMGFIWMLRGVGAGNCDILGDDCPMMALDKTQCGAPAMGTCTGINNQKVCIPFPVNSTNNSKQCNSNPLCRCLNARCVDTRDFLTSCGNPICPQGSSICNDPHMQGLRGQHIDVSGVDGGWYCLMRDGTDDLQVNVRFTAPLPEAFPHRQLVTGLSIVSTDHSLVIEARNPYNNPYNIVTEGCPEGTSPCLVDGGIRFVVDGQEKDELNRPTRDEFVVDGVDVSASNLPVECRQFGGDRIWAQMYAEMIEGTRNLRTETFKDWILKFKGMAAPDWCAKYISERNLELVQSNHAIIRIVTPTVVVRLVVGVNSQGRGELDWDGTVLPDLDFWQMDVGFEGLSLDHPELTGILGETARPVLDEEGQAVMEGYGALRGEVEDYRVSGPLGKDFALLHLEVM